MRNFEKTGQEIGSLVQVKNNEYGDSVARTGEMLKILYPEGISPEQYGDVGVLVRMFDKIFRIANGNQGEENAYQDIAGYAILMCAKEVVRNPKAAAEQRAHGEMLRKLTKEGW